jgi:hypothetical protein
MLLQLLQEIYHWDAENIFVVGKFLFGIFFLK